MIHQFLKSKVRIFAFIKKDLIYLVILEGFSLEVLETNKQKQKRSQFAADSRIITAGKGLTVSICLKTIRKDVMINGFKKKKTWLREKVNLSCV
jgi:hypothetical protein